MTNLFKKIARSAKKTFGKVKEGLSDTFKKGGYLSKGLNYADKGIGYGNRALNFVEKIPGVGSALAPITNSLKSGLNIANKLVDGTREAHNRGLDMYSRVRKGENVDNDLMSGLKQGYQGLKQAQRDAKAIDFKQAGKDTKTNFLEKAKEVKSGDPGVVYA
jgi:hypothetical protein